MIDFIKRLLLRLRGYNSPEAYWNLRWKLGLQAERWTPEMIKKEFDLINELMSKLDCHNILDIGCGQAQLRDLPGYVGLDLSEVSLKQSKLQKYIVGNISDTKLDVPAKGFDAVMTRFVLLHIRFDQIDVAVDNMCRIAGKLIVLREPKSDPPRKTHFHCFSHNLEEVFSRFEGSVIFLDDIGSVKSD